MKNLEEGKTYQLGSIQGTNDQEINFFKKSTRKMTVREYHNEKAGETLPEYFFDALDIDPDDLTDKNSTDKNDLVTEDGTSIEEVLKVLLAQFNYYQNIVPCEQNVKSIEKIKEVLQLQQERNSERRISGTYSSLDE